ncbi:MAG: hypothetical protein U5Q44_01830 [Dehalococcoidia bacterium]|nr:hypothetical protein [Dehalococcoidia bacterium]
MRGMHMIMSAPASSYAASRSHVRSTPSCGEGVTAGDDDEVIVPARFDRGRDLRRHLVRRDQVFDALVVVRALGGDLVFDLDGSRAGHLDHADGAGKVDGVAEADAAVDDHGDVDPFHDRAAGVSKLGGGQEGFGDGALVAEAAAEVHGAECRPASPGPPTAGPGRAARRRDRWRAEPSAGETRSELS